jgi:hypothetical protein
MSLAQTSHATTQQPHIHVDDTGVVGEQCTRVYAGRSGVRCILGMMNEDGGTGRPLRQSTQHSHHGRVDDKRHVLIDLSHDDTKTPAHLDCNCWTN